MHFMFTVSFKLTHKENWMVQTLLACVRAVTIATFQVKLVKVTVRQLVLQLTSRVGEVNGPSSAACAFLISANRQTPNSSTLTELQAKRCSGTNVCKEAGLDVPAPSSLLHGALCSQSISWFHAKRLTIRSSSSSYTMSAERHV